MRQIIVFVTLLLLLGVLGVSLALGASNTRAAARALLEQDAATAASASARPSASGAPASVSVPAPSGSAAPAETKPEVDRSLALVGLGWDLLAPALLAADGLKSSPGSAFGTANVQVTLNVASTMTDVERALASGGTANGGADLAVLPLSELVAAYERLRALDLRVFFVSGWSQGRDTLAGAALSKLPPTGSIAVAHTGGADALSLALLSLDLAGIPLERTKIDERAPDALLRAKSASLDQGADVLLSTREASRLLPYVLVAPRPLLEDREVVVAAFARGWLAGADALLKDRAKAARSLAAIESAPEALSLLQSLGDIEPIRLYENAALLGLAGRAAVSIESLSDWQFRARRAARVGRAASPEVSLVDGRVVTRLVHESPKLVKQPEPTKRRPSAAGAESLFARVFQKDDEEPILEAIGVASAVFPRHDLRLTLSGPAAKQTEWLDRAATRYDIERARLLHGPAGKSPGRAALLEVLRAP